VANAKRGIGAVAAAASDKRRNTTKYLDSVESVYRHVIQKQKNDMAAEIIDAGRFDQATTDAERKKALESCASPLAPPSRT
jgi:PHD/YefM family antitoxin component YafN of YafNO toxin-antitoxin module